MGNRSIFEVDGESVLSLSSNVKQIDVNMNELVTFDGSTITIMDGSDISRTISSVNQFIFADGFTFHNVTAPLMEPIMNMFTLSGTLFYNSDTNKVFYSIVESLNDGLSGEIDAFLLPLQRYNSPLLHQIFNPPLPHWIPNPPLPHQIHNPPLPHQIPNPPLPLQTHNPLLPHQTHNTWLILHRLYLPLFPQLPSLQPLWKNLIYVMDLHPKAHPAAPPAVYPALYPKVIVYVMKTPLE